MHQVPLEKLKAHTALTLKSLKLHSPSPLKNHPGTKVCVLGLPAGLLDGAWVRLVIRGKWQPAKPQSFSFLETKCRAPGRDFSHITAEQCTETCFQKHKKLQGTHLQKNEIVYCHGTIVLDFKTNVLFFWHFIHFSVPWEVFVIFE